MKKIKLGKWKSLIFLFPPIILLTGCMSSGGGGGGGGFDLVKFLQNPLVMVIIFIAVLYFMFKGGKH